MFKGLESRIPSPEEVPLEKKEEEEEDSIITSCLGSVGRWQFEKCFLLGLCAIPFSFHFMCYPMLTRVEEIQEEVNCEVLADPGGGGEQQGIWELLSAPSTTHVNLQSSFHLYCSRAYLLHLRQVIFFLGQLTGSLTSGFLSDGFGRKATMLAMMGLWAVSALLHVVAQDYAMFLMLQFVLAFSSNSAWTTSWVWMMEILGGKWRTILGLGTFLFWCIGYSSVVPITYFLPHWRQAWLLMSLPTVLFLLYTVSVPESPLWLISNGRAAEAKLILDEAAKRNGLPAISQGRWEKMLTVQNCNDNTSDDSNVVSVSPWSIVYTPNVRRKSLLLFSAWFVTGMTYYGLSLNSSDILGKDAGNTFLFYALIEVPALIFSILSILCLGRRLTLTALLLGVGVACLGAGLLPKIMGGGQAVEWVAFGLAVAGKFCIASILQVLFVYTAELYATPIRNTGVSVGTLFSKLGGIAAPFLVKLDFSSSAIITFGALGLLCAVGTSLLPETKGKKLPETLSEGEEFGKGDTLWTRRKIVLEEIETEVTSVDSLESV